AVGRENRDEALDGVGRRGFDEATRNRIRPGRRADVDYRQAFLQAIEEAAWDDETPRLVYADWLDEQGGDEEAGRQRKYVPSQRWLVEVARKHFGYEGEEQEEVSEGNYNSAYGQLVYFLKRHADGAYYLPFEIPCFSEYGDELWRHFEVVTG